VKVILGIDPGSRVAGFGVIRCAGEDVQYVSHGSLVLPVNATFAERLFSLGEELTQIYQRYQPHITVIERIFLGKNADSAFRLGHARGVCLYHAARAQSEVIEYATRSVKKGITGNGGADKTLVQTLLMAQFGLSCDSDLDASDALALAVYHARHLAVSENIRHAERRAAKECL
jgi:crossover junction endodeoxyribonuclease RuvC